MNDERINKRGPYKAAHLKKIQVSFRLSPHTVAALRKQPNQARVIEQALNQFLQLEPQK